MAPAVVYIAAVAPVASVADKPDEQSPAGRDAVIRGYLPVAESSAAHKRVERAPVAVIVDAAVVRVASVVDAAAVWVVSVVDAAVVPLRLVSLVVVSFVAARPAHVSLCRTPYRTSHRRPERRHSIYRI